MSDKKTIAVIGATGAQGGGLARAFAGAHGAFLVTNFWEHFSTERESKQAAAMARATKAAGVAHAVWSTLEDTRLSFPLDDPRLKTLQGKYKVPHFDAKGEADAIFAAEGAPTSYLMAAFYWENFIYFGQGPRKGPDGKLVLALPLGGGKLPGIAAEDIGKCAYGIFRRGPEAAGQRFGIAGEVLSGPEYAAAFSRHLGVPISFYDMPFDDYRALGFPGADDMGNMYEHHAILGEEFRRRRSPEVARALSAAFGPPGGAGSIALSAEDQNVPGTTASSTRLAEGKEWTTANLNVDASPSYCYDDAEPNCRRYGRMYTWESAQRVCQSLGGGWRLPTDDEWRQMAKRYGGVSQDAADEGKASFKALVSGGTSGFNAVFAGSRINEQYERSEAHGLYWTASHNDRATAPFYNFG